MFVLMTKTADILLTDGGAPQFAERCGVGSRFRYWVGTSGRRYLFTTIDAEELSGFTSGVVLLVRHGESGEAHAVEAITLFGRKDAARLARRLDEESSLVAYVHFLAESRNARQSILEDLAGSRQQLAA